MLQSHSIHVDKLQLGGFFVLPVSRQISWDETRKKLLPAAERKTAEALLLLQKNSLADAATVAVLSEAFFVYLAFLRGKQRFSSILDRLLDKT